MNIDIKINTPSLQGKHNANLRASINRLQIAKSYQDLSTVCIIPTQGEIATKVVQNWMTHIAQMNQKFVRIPTIVENKYDGFNGVIENIIQTPGLQDFKYILTLEEDVMPPFDGLLKLYESIGQFDAVGGLIWEKGVEGKPMVYGMPHLIPQSYLPIPVAAQTIQPCLALTTGFTLFKINIFKDQRIQKPWFVTNNVKRPDLYFFETIHKLGYKVACDTRVIAGHLDLESDIVW